MIRLLMLPSDSFGVGHYRTIWPAREIQKNHSDEFQVDIRLQVEVTDEDLDKYDIVHFHRRINEQEKTVEWIKKFQEHGVLVISDIDDYWTPFHGHPARDIVIKYGLPRMLLDVNRAADIVTTTTELYASHLRTKANPNVFVIPNAVDTEMAMWKSTAAPSDRVRVAWIGGSSHQRDLDRIKGTVHKLLVDPDVKDKIQIVMCGYDIRGTITETNPVTKEERTRPITPAESVWNKFEAIFNADGLADKNQYVRRKTLPITQYGKHYDFCDICLAPLDQHTFNECKSELKIIETGMKGKALIASDLYVYHDLLTHEKNALLVNPKKDHKDWAKCIKRLVLDSDLRNELANNLHDFVNPRYTMKTVTTDRCKFYKEALTAHRSKKI